MTCCGCDGQSLVPAKITIRGHPDGIPSYTGETRNAALVAFNPDGGDSWAELKGTDGVYHAVATGSRYAVAVGCRMYNYDGNSPALRLYFQGHRHDRPPCQMTPATLATADYTVMLITTIPSDTYPPLNHRLDIFVQSGWALGQSSVKIVTPDLSRLRGETATWRSTRASMYGGGSIAKIARCRTTRCPSMGGRSCSAWSRARSTTDDRRLRRRRASRCRFDGHGQLVL